MVLIIMNFKWLLKQFLPLKYETFYRNSDGERFFCSWRMWFGKVFNVNDVRIE